MEQGGEGRVWHVGSEKDEHRSREKCKGKPGRGDRRKICRAARKGGSQEFGEEDS